MRPSSFSGFILRNRRLVIVAWIAALAISVTQAPTFFNAVSYNVTGTNLGGPSNTESAKAQAVLIAEFPAGAAAGREGSSSSNSIVVVLRTADAYSPGVKAVLLGLNRSAASDRALAGNFTGMDSVYSPGYSPLLSRDFVSRDNTTMLAIYNFLSLPDQQQITAFQNDAVASGLGAQGQYWITGGAVVSQDVSNVFGPTVGVTVVPGVLASLVVVGLLLLSPLAALIPVTVGGIAIAVSLPLIYLGVVRLGHGTLGFLTPTLTILLVLALSVDYSVLQLRRTREERLKGRPSVESVAVSMRWAGQAVLTAGATVVVAYVVMAVTNVPLFNTVGEAIAIGVAVLVAAALTLVPAIEASLGDWIFWPSLNRARRAEKPSRLRSLAGATLRHKVAVVAVMGCLALGAFYVSHQATGGADILRLLPDFPSNQGLMVMTDEFGSGITGPTKVLMTMPTPIINDTGQLNQTLLVDIETVTSAVAGSGGVATADSPTSPYGSPVNLTAIAQLPQLERSAYLAGALADIGRDNRTLVVNVGFKMDPDSQAAIEALLAMEAKVKSLPLPRGTAIYFAGETQSTLDSQSFLDGVIPQVILTLAVAIYAILFIQLRSAFTPIRLILTILCSVAFSLAALTLTFYYALSLPIFDFAPLFVVVTMLGVGIDYDIFLVTRIREEALDGKSDDEAIKTALSKSWVTIFGLGLVLSSVFSSVVFTGIALLQQIGLVVALAVMIDVSTVILFFVPALMGLAEKYNWWPAKIKRA